MKKDNNSKYYKDWTTAKLKDEWRGYNQAINETECYGSGDIQALCGIEAELLNRGIKPKITI
jgi:hypothetical protein|tara:strand:- start:1955 stop:2140 length:186 start_codon:yes stop_codon:yes gene_type:complete